MYNEAIKTLKKERDVYQYLIDTCAIIMQPAVKDSYYKIVIKLGREIVNLQLKQIDYEKSIKERKNRDETNIFFDI